MRFEDKVVLITGGASGIGREVAVQFAREGATILISDINEEGGEETLKQVLATGAQAQFMQADVTRGDDHALMVKTCIDTYGGLHVAVNSAGISGTFIQTVIDYPEDEFDKVVAINLKGVWLSMKHQIPAMLESGGGSIVNLASVAGLLGVYGGADYSASKHGVIGLTKSVALEFATQNIRVNAVCPSFIETPMVTRLTDQSSKFDKRTRMASPMRRLGQPEEVASMVLWLASDDASFVNAGVYTVDGGLTAM